MPQVAYRPHNPFEVQDSVHFSPFDVEYQRHSSHAVSMQKQLKKQKSTIAAQPFDIGSPTGQPSARPFTSPAIKPAASAKAPVGAASYAPTPAVQNPRPASSKADFSQIDITRISDPAYVSQTVDKAAKGSVSTKKKIGKVMFIIAVIICVIIVVDSFTNGFSVDSFMNAVSDLIVPVIFACVGYSFWKGNTKKKDPMTIK